MDLYFLRVNLERKFRKDEYEYAERLFKKSGYEEKPKTYSKPHSRVNKSDVGIVREEFSGYEAVFLNLEDLQKHREEINKRFREGLERQQRITNDKLVATMYHNNLDNDLEVIER